MWAFVEARHSLQKLAPDTRLVRRSSALIALTSVLLRAKRKQTVNDHGPRPLHNSQTWQCFGPSRRLLSGDDCQQCSTSFSISLYFAAVCLSTHSNRFRERITDTNNTKYVLLARI